MTEGELRIGDSERDTAAAALGEHFAAGRLDSEEYDERIGQVWAARTRGQLPPLFDDLPGGPPAELRLAPQGWAREQAQPPTDHWVAAPSQWKQRQQAVTSRAAGLPTWLLVVAGIVMVPLVIGLVTSAMPLLIAGAVLWFFLAGPGKCAGNGHHRWNRSVRG